ncbi:MAG: DUF4928 family protein [Tepidisphaera sp.]
MDDSRLRKFIDERFRHSGTLVPARLQTAMALVEAMRNAESTRLEHYLTESGASLRSHETLGRAAHDRIGMSAVRSIHGRRSNNVQEWGQSFIDLVVELCGDSETDEQRLQKLDLIQRVVAEPLRARLGEKPMLTRLRGKTAKAVVDDILRLADKRGNAAAVAQCLVGAKLMLRFPQHRNLISVVRYNQGDRTPNARAGDRRGDFDVLANVFEVTIGPPDQKHFEQAERVLKDLEARFWLIVREDRLQFWIDEAGRRLANMDRLHITSVQGFVGQNVSEVGGLSTDGEFRALVELIRLYNEVWVAKAGDSSMLVEAI